MLGFSPYDITRSMKAQISLRICAGWPEPSLPAYRINRYCMVYGRTEKALISWRRQAGWYGPWLLVYCMRPVFALCISVISGISFLWDDQNDRKPKRLFTPIYRDEFITWQKNSYNISRKAFFESHLYIDVYYCVSVFMYVHKWWYTNKICLN